MGCATIAFLPLFSGDEGLSASQQGPIQSYPTTRDAWKALLRRAQLQWHPDKNPQNEIVATIIFRSVQAE